MLAGDFLSPAVALAALLLTDGLGGVQPPLARGLAVILLAIHYARWKAAGPSHARTGGVLIQVLGWGAIALLASLRIGVGVVAVPASLGLLAYRGVPEGRRRDLIDLARWSLLYGSLSLLYNREPTCRQICEESCSRVSNLLDGLLTGLNWPVGSTGIGFSVILAFVAAVGLACSRMDWGSRPWAMCASAGLLAAAIPIYLATCRGLAEAYRLTSHFAVEQNLPYPSHAGQHEPEPFGLGPLLSMFYPMNYSIFLAGMLYAAFKAIYSQPVPSLQDPRPTRTVLSSRWFACLSLLSLASNAVLWLLPFMDIRHEGGLRVLINTEDIDRSVPTFGRYGDRSAGMFGFMERHLRNRGCTVTARPLVEVGDLGEFDVIIVMNLQRRFPEDVKRNILEFVNSGGGLLLAGDHTGLEGLRDPANDLVGGLGIRLNFDSAKPVHPNAVNAMTFLRHPTTDDLDWWYNKADLWVGASLDVSPPAYPVIIGRYYFSDPGDATNHQGNLGDLKFSPGERLGDQVLVAAREAGLGKVVVWGDTSAIQNLSWTISAPFMERTLGWLARPAVPGWRALRIGTSVGALISAIFLTWAACSPRRIFIAAILLFSLPIASSALERHSRPRFAYTPSAFAFIDLTHIPDVNLDGWLRDGHAGLAQMVARYGLEPCHLYDWGRDPWRGSSVVFFLSPMKALSSSEEGDLLDYMDRGGRAVVSLGWEERAGFGPFLEKLGLRLMDSPLGKMEGVDSRGNPVKFENIWPIETRAVTGWTSEVLARCDGLPCVVEIRNASEGALVLIGDSRFLRNHNLEDRSGAVPENMAFLARLLGTSSAPPPSSPFPNEGRQRLSRAAHRLERVIRDGLEGE